MSIARRLAKFINKSDKQSSDVSYWQSKYFSVWERHPHAIIEVENKRISYFNSRAEEVFSPEFIARNMELGEMFGKSRQLSTRANFPMLIPLKGSKRMVLVDLELKISKDHFYLRIQPDTLHGEPTPIVNMKRATNLLCNSLNDGFLTCDLNGKIIYSNASFRRMTGYDEAWLENAFLRDISDETSFNKELKLLEDIRKERRVRIYQKKMFGKDRTALDVEVQAYPFVLDTHILGFWFIIRALPEERETHDVKNQLRSITEAKKKLELQNRELFEKGNIFSNFIHQSAEGICLIDQEGKIIEWNQSMSDLFEVERDRYLQKYVWDFDYDYLPPERKSKAEYQRIKKIIQDFLQAEEQEIFEGEYEKTINGRTKFIQFRAFPIETGKGKIFGRINLDVTERKAAEFELEDYKTHLEKLVESRTRDLQRSEAHLRLIIKSTPLAYYSYPKNKRNEIWYSEHIEQLTGYSIQDLGSNPGLWEESINPEDFDLVRGTFDNLSPDQHVSCEYRWKTASGSEIWILDQATLIADPETGKEQIVGCFLNITQRKNYEQSIKESESYSRTIFNSSKHAIFIHDLESGKIEDVNDTMLKMYNTTYEKALESKPGDLSLNRPPFNMEAVFKHFEVVREKGVHVFEWMAKTTDGRLFWTEVDLRIIVLNGREKIMALVRDIDQKKKTEALILYRTEFEKLLFNISTRFINMPVQQVDENITSAFKEIVKFTQTDVAYLFQYNDEANTLSLRYHWKNSKSRLDPSRLMDFDQSLITWHSSSVKQGKPLLVEESEKIPEEGKLLRELVLSMNLKAFIDVPIFFQGDVIGFMGLGTGKSGRKWLEEEVSLLQVVGQILINAIHRKESMQSLQESEQTHREIYNATNEAIIVHDPRSGKVLDVNEAMLDMFGVTYDEALSMHLQDFGTAMDGYTEPEMIEMMEKTMQEGPQVLELQSQRKNGSAFWIEISLKRAEIKGKASVLSVIRDITERKQSEETLRESEEKYRLLIEGQSDLIVKIDTEGRFLFVSPSYCEMFGKTEEELLGKKFMPLVHENDQEATAKAMENLYQPPWSCYIEQRAYTKTGWRWLAWNDKAILDENQQVKEIVGVARDITYQKGVEEALRRSEDRFRSIVQQLTDIVLIMDEKSIIVYDTPSVKKVLGYDEGSLVGRRLIDLVNPEDALKAEENFKELVQAPEKLVTTEIRVKNAKNEYLLMETIGFNLLNHPSIKGMIVTLRDISERKQVEKMILEAVITTEENERERFAKNLHDDLGPLLSSIKMYINSLNTASDTSKQEFIIQQLNEVIREAIVTTKEVSNDLSPHILINYGLVSALESFLKKIPPEINLSFDTDLTTERYSNTIENSVYRISKELINNTLKHAGASSIKILLTEKGQKLNLDYSDNGTGMDMETLKPGKHSGMGLSNIMSRARTLDGKTEFMTRPGKGFSFKMSIPIHQGLK